MKHLLFILFMLFAGICSSQQVIDLDAIAKTPKTEQQLIGTAKPTKDSAIYMGNKYVIYVSKEKGKRFIIYPKTKGKNIGQPAKKYIPA